MRAQVIAIAALIGLTGCVLLDPPDPRLGGETAEECAARVSGLLRPGSSYREFENNAGVPIFTYDITKLALGDMQELIEKGGDETLGRRLLEGSNEISTAVSDFMRVNVDEKGAFFMGRDPSLYRVRGAAQPLENMIASGCERQLQGMRLIMIDVAPERVKPFFCPPVSDELAVVEMNPDCLPQDENENEN